jgi:hypothetical protein
MSKTGATVYGFHEGTRSEYFAQCVLSAFGTSIPVPHPEDTGIDFYCTLTEQVRQLSWAKASYSVQVKSDGVWVLEGRESVDWLIKHPLPLFLGVMDKKTLTFHIYHTAPRFYPWALGDSPDRLELTMTNEGVGQSTQWIGDYKFSLVPILSIEMARLASDSDYAQNARDVLEYWIGVENRNLARIMVNLRGWEMPDEYETNVLPRGGRVSQWLGKPSPEFLNNSVRSLSDQLELLARQFHDTGHQIAAIEAALLFRHLTKNFPDAFHDPKAAGGLLSYIAMSLNKTLGKNRYVFEGLDVLETLLESTVRGSWQEPPPLTKRELCRRSVLLCITFLRNLAYYRTGQGQHGRHLLDASEPTVNFWRQANSNFIDMCVLDWCKLFADKRAVHHWRKIVSDPAKFEADLLAHLNVTADEFQHLIDKVRFYRDKFVAHLDELNEMDVPTLDLLAKAIWFYHAHIVTNEVQPGDLAGIPTGTPEKFNQGYDQCIQEAERVFERFS